MWTTIAIVAGATALAALTIYIALNEARMRARSEVEAKYAERIIQARKKMDDALARGVGRRRKLLDFLRRQETDLESKK
ncbi:MAG: hypothetical protein CL793_07560 [Chloroflexi bacterium]|nr:hypothetical protein [Chloroflexota bacterium]|tara:strand:- start:2537 stop:2773 length:237 start_codon:yes stop_codon:yes gene_type:complete